MLWIQKGYRSGRCRRENFWVKCFEFFYLMCETAEVAMPNTSTTHVLYPETKESNDRDQKIKCCNGNVWIMNFTVHICYCTENIAIFQIDWNRHSWFSNRLKLKTQFFHSYTSNKKAFQMRIICLPIVAVICQHQRVLKRTNLNRSLFLTFHSWPANVTSRWGPCTLVGESLYSEVPCPGGAGARRSMYSEVPCVGKSWSWGLVPVQ